MRQAGAGEAAVSAAEELRDVADVLSIEAGTDANIKQALQAILNIAARLEGSATNGKAEEKAPPRAERTAQTGNRRADAE